MLKSELSQALGKISAAKCSARALMKQGALLCETGHFPFEVLCEFDDRLSCKTVSDQSKRTLVSVTVRRVASTLLCYPLAVFVKLLSARIVR